MITMMQGWQGKVQVNGTIYPSMEAFIKANKPLSGDFHIKLYSKTSKPVNELDNSASEAAGKQEYRITVKAYMTRPTEQGSTFNFMAKMNNNIPMPLRTMVGHIIGQTPGMYKMELHGDMYAEKMCTCMKCGRKLDNPVSQYFGIGPECGSHGYVNPFDSDEELKQAVAAYRKQLQAMTWTGWVIKSAITKMEEVK